MKLCCILFILHLSILSAQAAERPNAVNLYLGQLTSNHWEELFRSDRIDFKDSYLWAFSYARRIGGYKDLLSYELEGQVVKHFKRQTHWEFNALATIRWEKFYWDKWLDTSLAFGLGPSYATKKPEVEIEIEGDTEKLLVYWMLELAMVPFANKPELELISRIHHRSEAYGLVADEGGSNALALGFRYRF